MLLLPLAVQILEAECFLVGCLQVMDKTVVDSMIESVLTLKRRSTCNGELHHLHLGHSAQVQKPGMSANNALQERSSRY